MQVSVDETGSLTRKMTIAVPSAEFEGRIADRLKDTATRVSLPGFRRGKVPLREVERRYGDAVRSKVATEVVQSSLEDAIRDRQIPLVGSPTVEVANAEPGADLEFTATFEVLPDIDLVDLTTLRVRKPVAEIGESDIDDMVESLRKQRTEWNGVERPVAVDDRVVVDYSFQRGGEVQGEPNVDFTFVVGASQAPAQLDAAVVGMSPGESRAFPISNQRDSAETSSQGEMIGEVVVKSVAAPSLPALDEAFFASFAATAATGDAPASEDGATADARPAADDSGTPDPDGTPEGGEQSDDDGPGDEAGAAPTAGDEGLAAARARFRADVRERMNAELETATRTETRRQVMVSLASAHGFELPRVLVEEELEQERQRMAEIMGVAVELAQLGEPIRRRVEDRIRTRLIVREIVQREGLQADDTRIRARIEDIASAYERPDDVRNWIYGDETQLQRVELGVLEDELVEHVLSQVEVEPVAASYKDVVTGNSIPADQAPLTADADIAEPPKAPAEPGGDVADREEDASEPEQPGAEKPRKGRLRRWLTGRH